MKNKIILSILIVSMIALIFSGCDGVDTVIPPIPDDEEISDYFRLDVPYIEQNSNNTCLPASGAIILKYYEDPRDIAEIRDKLALPWQEDGTGGIMVSGHGYIAKLFDYVKSLGFTTKTEWDGLTIEEIKDKLEDGFPIIVLQDFYLDSNKEYDGHFSVIVGYRETGDNDEENKLIINDPWSSRGQYWEVTYSDFKIRNSNWWKEQHNRNSDLSHSYIIWKDTSTTNIYTITASAGSHGSISPSGDVTVNQGSDKSFTITSDIGYSIDGVLVDGISVGAVSSYTFTNVTEDHTISATFRDFPVDNMPVVETFSVNPTSVILGDSFNISYTVSDDIGLQQTELWRANDVGGEPGDWDTQDNPIFTKVLSGQKNYSGSFTDTPDAAGTYWYGIHVVNTSGNWSVEPKPPGPIVVTVTSVTPETYTITTSAGSHGSISPSGDVTVNQGSDKSFTITPNTGYSINDVLVDGSSIGAENSYTFTNVTQDHTISATFIIEEAGTYDLRDIGPAGGYIFYDKGSYSDGWRYLEAAPVSTEFTGKEWDSFGTLIGGTGTGIGIGQSNTTIIVTWLNSHGETDCAAQLCDALVYGGYSDWFLPSKDELRLMYENLKYFGVGGFADYVYYCLYWSSSEYYAYGYGAWGQFFDIGWQNFYNKNYFRLVRAVRAF